MNALQSFLLHDSQNRDDGPEGTLTDLADWLINEPHLRVAYPNGELVQRLRGFFDARWVERAEVPDLTPFDPEAVDLGGRASPTESPSARRMRVIEEAEAIRFEQR